MEKPSWKIKDKVLYVTCGAECFKLIRQQCTEVPDLTSTQEEADTHLLLHADHAAKTGYKTLVVTAEDIDVMICVGLRKNIQCPIYQKCGTNNRTRYTDIHSPRHVVGGTVSEGLCWSACLHSL